MDAGIRIVANIKPALLADHPRFAEVEAFQGFVRDADDPTKPHMTQFWGGMGGYLDFTNPKTSAWWTARVTDALLEKGIVATWNDNNEFEVWDPEAPVAIGGLGGTMAAMRPVETQLMLRASAIAQKVHAPLQAADAGVALGWTGPAALRPDLDRRQSHRLGDACATICAWATASASPASSTTATTSVASPGRSRIRNCSSAGWSRASSGRASPSTRGMTTSRRTSRGCIRTCCLQIRSALKLARAAGAVPLRAALPGAR